MPFGLTYAEFVMGVGLSMFFGPADVAPQAHSWALTLGTTTQAAATRFDENFVTLTHRRDAKVWGAFTPIYALGVSDQGTGFVSAGVGRPLDVFGLKITPHAGPALFSDTKNSDSLQFRTGFDINQPLGPNTALSGGYYHISNAQNNDTSADVDVAHLGLKVKF